MTQEELDRVHEIDKEILFYIDDFCKEYNIEYKLFFGSLLGAVRHKGIIPWDDDVDLVMDRANYFKFLNEAKVHLSAKYDLHISYSNSEEGGISEMKIGKKGTIYCDRVAKELNVSNKVQVDIFLCDYIKDYWKSHKCLGNTIVRFVKMSTLPWDEKRLLFYYFKRNSIAKAIVLIPLFSIIHIIPLLGCSNRLYRLIKTIFVDDKCTSSWAGSFSSSSFKTFCDSSLIKESCKLEFEGRLMNCPRHYDGLLKKWYGDYLQLPPEEKRYVKGFENWVFEE